MWFFILLYGFICYIFAEKTQYTKTNSMDNDVFYNQLSLEEERLIQRLSKIKELKELYGGSLKPIIVETKDTIDLKRKKKTGLTIPQRVYAALKEITEGRVDDVAKVLSEKIDTSFSFESAKKNAAYHLSKLYRKGKISATGEKRKGYTYSIKKAGS